MNRKNNMRRKAKENSILKLQQQASEAYDGSNFVYSSTTIRGSDIYLKLRHRERIEEANRKSMEQHEKNMEFLNSHKPKKHPVRNFFRRLFRRPVNVGVDISLIKAVADRY